MTKRTHTSVLDWLEMYFGEYCAFPDPSLAFVCALWTLATWTYRTFDAFPYVVISAATKRAGKTRLAELFQFVAYNAQMSTAMTPAVMFRCIGDGATVIFDESEVLSSEAQTTMRQVLNAGYRRSGAVMRMKKDEVVTFPAYSPKIFVLIGDVYDTLKDRSIVLELVRGIPKRVFNWSIVEADTKQITGWLTKHPIDVVPFENIDLSYLSGREAEIWLPLFALCQTLAPSRLSELTRMAADLAARKTEDRKRVPEPRGAEAAQTDTDYAYRALADLADVFRAHGSTKCLRSVEAVAFMREIPSGPWRTYRGDGLTPIHLSNLLARFSVNPKPCRNRAQVFKGYKSHEIIEAHRKNSNVTV